MRSHETAVAATILFFARHTISADGVAVSGVAGTGAVAATGIAGPDSLLAGGVPGSLPGGTGIVPDMIPDRLLRAWIADDVCGCEAFFIGGKRSPVPCGLPERGALPVFAFGCALGLYFAGGGKAGDAFGHGRPEVWLLFLQFQAVLRLVRSARHGGCRIPPVDVFDFACCSATVRQLKACIGAEMRG